MIEIRPADAAKYLAELDVAFALLEAQMAQKVDSFAREVYSSIVLNSPQWSQNFASNWNFSVGQPDTTYTEHPNKEAMQYSEAPFYRGANPVVSDVISRLNEAPALKWGETAYFTNATPNGYFGYLLDNMEQDGKDWLRPVNLLGGQVALIEYAVGTFGSRRL